MAQSRFSKAVVLFALPLFGVAGCFRTSQEDASDDASVDATDAASAPSTADGAPGSGTAGDAGHGTSRDAEAPEPPDRDGASTPGGNDAASPSLDAGPDAASGPVPALEAGADHAGDAAPPFIGVDAGGDAAIDTRADSGSPMIDEGRDGGVPPLPIDDDAGEDPDEDWTTPPNNLDQDDVVESDMGPPEPPPSVCNIQVGVRASQVDPTFVAEAAELTNWTTWQGNAAHNGWVPLSLDVTRFARRWTYEDYGRRLSELTVDGGVLVLSSGIDSVYRPGKILHALSVQSGRRLWTYDAVLEDSLNAPAISDGVVYAQVGAQSWAKVVAFDALNGAVLWTAPFETQWPHFLSPTVDGEDVFIGGGAYGGMYAFDKSTGAERWYVRLPQEDGFTPTPRAHDVVALVGDSLHVVDRVTGSIQNQIEHPGLDGWAVHTVPVETSATTFVGVGSEQLFAFDLSSRSVSWTLKDAFAGQPVYAAGTLYVRNGKAIEARDPQTGNLVWSWSPAQGTLALQFLVTDNLAFVSTDTATHAIDLATRAEVWSYPEAGKLAIGQGTLFIAGDTRVTAIDVLGDRDMDGLPDYWELHHAGGDVDPKEDPDGDALDNAQEWAHETQPGCADSDGDGLTDGVEVELAFNPTDADSDSDSLGDRAEVEVHSSDANSVDSDADGVPDDLEVKVGLDPASAADALADDDGDGYLNAHEALARTDHRDPAAIPRPTDWAMHQGNARHDGYQPLWLDASRFRPLWSTTLDDQIHGVALGERHVVATTMLSTATFDADDGRLRWRVRLPALDSDGFKLWAYNGAPSLYAGNIYVHSSDSPSAALWVRDARTGSLLYRAYNGNQSDEYLAPTLFKGRLHMNGGYYGGLVTLNAYTGESLWTLTEPQADGEWEPAVTEGRLWLVQRSALHAFDPETGTAGDVAEPRLPYRTPVLDRDGNAYLGPDDNYPNGEAVLALHRESGKRRWTSEHGPAGKHGEPVAGNYRVYAIRNGSFNVYHPVSGRRLWQWQPTGEALISNVVVTATHVFVASNEATYALDLATQSVGYKYPLGGQLAVGGEALLAIFSGSRLDVISLEGDVDGDGIAEWWERAQQRDVTAQEDEDGDRLDALGEFLAETSPRHRDSDKDGLSDAEEIANGSSPLVQDSDGDGVEDGREVHQMGSEPTSPDSDGDGIPDGTEIGALLDPNDASDAAEDLDGDRFSNFHEALAATNPREAASFPDIHDWAMFRGGPDHAQSQPLMLDPKDFVMAWTAAFDGPGYVNGRSAIDDEHVYVRADDRLRALSVHDGHEIWSVAMQGGGQDPTVGGGLVYVHESGRPAAITALDRLDGRVVFSTEHASQGFTFYAPTLDDGVLVCPAGEYGGIIAVDAFDGHVLWQAEHEPWEGWEPAMRDGHAYVFGGHMRSYDVLTGELAYSIEPTEALRSARWNQQTTLALSQSGLLIAGGFTALASFDPSTGAERWRTPSTRFDFGLPAVAAGRIYATRDGMLEVFAESSGKLLWTWSADETLLADNVLVTATHLFVSGATTTYAVDLATKQEAWRYGAGGELALSAEGLLVITTDDNVNAVRLLP